jgi:hypothetical protein
MMNIITNESDQALMLSFLAAQGNDSVYINILYTLLTNEKTFKTMVLQFLEDTRTSKADPKFVKIMTYVWESYTTGDSDQKMDPVLNVTLKDYADSNVAIVNLQQALVTFAPNQRAVVISKLITLAESIAGPSSALANYTSRALSFAEKAGALAPVAIVAVLLSWEALKSISAWWKGHISGTRCAANIINAVSTIGGGVVVCAIGTLLGTLLVPGIGSVIGGFAGGIIGSTAAAAFSKWLTEYFFDLPPTVALEKAYGFLNLKPSCTNSDINVQFKKLVLKYHPDHGGSAEDFHTLQVSLAIIKQSRGQGV